MDSSGALFSGLTLASIITTSGLAINMTENFGTLAANEHIKQEVDSDRLVGPYGNAVAGMSSVVIGLSALYLAFFIYGWYEHRKVRSPAQRMQRIYWIVMLLAVVLGTVSAALNLSLVEQGLSQKGLTTSPNPPVAGENYKLRGSYGQGTLGMASSAVAVSGISFIWMLVLLGREKAGARRAL